MKDSNEEIWWRVVDSGVELRNADSLSLLTDDDDIGKKDEPPCISFQKWYVIKHTPKGVWLSNWKYEKDRRLCRWTSKVSYRRWAYPKKADALASYRVRKLRQVQHLRARLDTAEPLHEAMEKWSIIEILEATKRRDEIRSGELKHIG